MTPTEWLLYYENAVGRIWEHPDGFAVVQYKSGTRQLEYFQAFLTHVGRLLTQRGWARILSDQRPMTAFTPEESAWIVGYWLDQNQQRPDKVYGAVIIPDDMYAQLSVNQVMADAEVAALTYRLFESEPDAMAWLAQVPH